MSRNRIADACARLVLRAATEVSRHPPRFLIALVVAGLFDSGGGASAEVVKVGLFRTYELHSANLLPFPKWRDMLSRFEREVAECAPDHCRLGEWRQLVESLRGRNSVAQLRLITKAVNRHHYVEDWANWALADYWETPLQFLDRSGDCEDFAITKYLALRTAGMPAENMRIVIVRDTARQRMHAVLAAYVDGRAFILDSLDDNVVESDAIDHYEPIYSINEQGWWLHRH